MSTVGARIRERRKFIGLTQQELAEKAHISMMSIRRYENGDRDPNMETLNKIADALGVSGLDLTGFTSLFKAVDSIRGGMQERCDTDSINSILPAELTDFSMFIEKMGYYITLKEEQYYIVNGDKCTKIALDDLKTLVRTSKAMIKGLLDDMMNRE